MGPLEPDSDSEEPPTEPLTAKVLEPLICPSLWPVCAWYRIVYENHPDPRGGD